MYKIKASKLRVFQKITEALCEYIWIEYEANATEIRLSGAVNATKGLDSISIYDNCNGFNYNNLSDTSCWRVRQACSPKTICGYFSSVSE